MRTKKITLIILFMPFSMFSKKTGNIKTLIFALFCVILTTDLYGQNTFPQNGNVGIGTLSPSNKLQLIGGISSSDVSEIYGVRFSLENTYYRQIMAPGFNLLINSGSGDAHFLMPYNSSSNARLNNLGLIVDKNMGIGTAVPEDRLTVLMDPTSNGNGIAVKAAANQGAGSQPGYAYLNSSGNRRMYNYLDIQTDTYNIANAQASNLLSINQSGNVGIGISTPGIWFPGKVLEIRDDRPILRISPNSDGGVGTISFKGAWGAASESTDEFHLNYVSSSTNPRLALVSYTGGTYNQLLTIKGNGNIGIGTEIPKEKLSVNGKIRAHEIKVETANWSDFVFEKDYQLPILLETEKHIKEKGHLPGIPSADDVKANGIDLGEMNAKLLQKIEELTLHLINLNNTVNELKNEVNLLKKK